MAEDQMKAQGKRDRSPSFPYIGLQKAHERIKVLFETARRHDVRVADVARDWGLAPKSSSTDRNVAALLAYGLIEDSGSGPNRKIKISDTGWRILEDKRPGVRENLLSEAATKPRIIGEYFQKWMDGRPDDSHALSELQFEGGFTDDGAKLFLRVFDETVRFVSPHEPESDLEEEISELQNKDRPKIGDLVQRIDPGVEKFDTPLQVIGLSDDGKWLWVENFETALPISDVQIEERGTVQTEPPAPPPHVMAAMGSKMKERTFGVREEKFALVEGDVIISYPEAMSTDSVEDLAAYVEVFLKKARREAGTAKNQE